MNSDGVVVTCHVVIFIRLSWKIWASHYKIEPHQQRVHSSIHGQMESTKKATTQTHTHTKQPNKLKKTK